MYIVLMNSRLFQVNLELFYYEAGHQFNDGDTMHRQVQYI